MLQNQDDAVRDRRRRLVALLCSLMSMVLVLSLLSTPNRKTSTNNDSAEPNSLQINPFHGPQPSPQPDAALARAVSALPMGDFPANITGKFSGKWDTSSVTINRTFAGPDITYVPPECFQDLSLLCAFLRLLGCFTQS